MFELELLHNSYWNRNWNKVHDYATIDYIILNMAIIDWNYEQEDFLRESEQKHHIQKFKEHKQMTEQRRTSRKRKA